MKKQNFLLNSIFIIIIYTILITSIKAQALPYARSINNYQTSYTSGNDAWSTAASEKFVHAV